MLYKWVQIIRGEFKGQIGRVTHVVGEEAFIEMSVRAKQVTVPLVNLKLRDPEEVVRSNDFMRDSRADDGGQTAYRGG